MSDCVVCGTQIPPKRYPSGPDRLYCSHRCCRRASIARREWRQKRAEQPIFRPYKRREVYCVVCGIEIPPERRCYCSGKCREKAAAAHKAGRVLPTPEPRPRQPEEALEITDPEVLRVIESLDRFLATAPARLAAAELYRQSMGHNRLR